jgi:hypothetical protein
LEDDEMEKEKIDPGTAIVFWLLGIATMLIALDPNGTRPLGGGLAILILIIIGLR